MRDHRSNIKKGVKNYFCSRKCTQEYQRSGILKFSCKNCNKQFTSKESTRKFCSQTCSTTYNNFNRKILNPKFCQECSIFIERGNFCDECIQIQRLKKGLDFTKLTLQNVKDKFGSQYHAKIRGWSRAEFNRHNPIKSCAYCGYDKHIDVCHIKEVRSFPMYTPISIVNALDNLVGLCKNHHWELDHGHLKITQIL